MANPILTKVATGSVGADQKLIYDVFAGTEHIQSPADPRLKGVDIASLPTGTAPTGFISAFKPAVNPITKPFGVDFNGTVDSGAFVNPVSNGDIEKKLADYKIQYDQMIADNKALQQKYLDASNPTQAESDLGTQLTDLRSKASLDTINTNAVNSNIQAGSQTSSHIAGATANENNQAQFRQQTYAVQESNLLNRLGIEQTKRTGILDGIKTALGFNQTNADLYQKMIDTINAEQNKIVANANKLSDNARNTLGTILDKFSGLDLHELDPATQGRLATIAGQAGIPLALLTAGMKSAKDATLLADAQKNKPDVFGTETGGYYQQSFNPATKQWETKKITGGFGMTNAKMDTRVKQIVAMNPGEWGHAAAQIDAEFGKGTATKYDDYLKKAYTKTENKNYTATNIPPEIMKNLQEDIAAGNDLGILISSYPEVSPSFITSMYWNL